MLVDLKREVATVLGIAVSDVLPSVSFIDLGGNSLSAIALTNSCRQHGIWLNVQSILTASNLSKLWEQSISHENNPRKRLKIDGQEASNNDNDNQESLLDLQHTQQTLKPNFSTNKVSSSQLNGTSKGHASSTENQAQITHMQLSFIHGAQSQPGTNIIHYYETYPPDKLSVVKEAWRTVLQSEPIFRTDFDLHKESGVMTERETTLFRWSETVVESEERFDTEVKEIHRNSEVTTSFKVVILQSKNSSVSKCTVIWRTHHCLIDGHSSAIVVQKVRRVAAGLSIQTGLSFVALARNLDLFRRTWKSTGEEFWKQQRRKFGMGNGMIAFPQTEINPEHQLLEPITIAISISRPQLSEYAQSSGVTEASLYYAAWALVLSQYIGSDTITIGAIFSGRGIPLEGVNETVGSMVNTLPFHVTLDRGSSVQEYIRGIFLRLAELSTFEWTIPQDGYSRDFSTAVSVFLDGCPESLEGVAPLGRPSCQLLTDVPLNIGAYGDGTIAFTFSDPYAKATISKMIEMYREALSLIMKPSESVDTCLKRLFNSYHLEELMAIGNGFLSSTTASSVDDDLVSLFDKSTASFPTDIAVKKGSTLMQYAELDRASSTVSDYLKSALRPRSVVCVHADRSINWIVAIYGILKADTVYCPIDSTLPADLRKSYSDITQSSLFLVSKKDQISDFSNLEGQVVSVEDILLGAKPLVRSEPLPMQLHREEYSRHAYVCFTSGSTGKPKGVMCTHEGLVAFQKDPEVRLFANPGRRIAQLMSPAFDGSIHEIFSALSYGATLVLSSSPNTFEHLAEVDSAILTPSVARMLSPSDYPQLSTVYLVGEAVSQVVNDKWAAVKQLYNMYGPTEATCGATIKRLRPGELVTIGKPNSSSRMYILDERQRLLPRGVIGEIYLAGVQVSCGYIGRPLETARRFMHDSICSDLGGQMYRTGDRGYWNGDGEIVFLGRTDRQVKLRGFRLDLNDIETRILNVVSSATSVSVTTAGEFLVAMLQPDSLDLSVVRSLVSKSLHPSAVPRRLAAVKQIPLTQAGKVDYKAIAAFEFPSLRVDREQQMSPSQQVVASIWRSILGLSDDVKIDKTSSFLDLGGNSIPMLLLSHRLAAKFTRAVPLKIIMETSTLEELTHAVEELPPTKIPRIEGSRQTLGPGKVSPIEFEWCTKYQLSQESACFNVSYACTITDGVDRSKLAIAWNTVLSRHIILRCRYLRTKGAEVERVPTDSPPRVQRLRRIDIRKEVNAPFLIDRQHPIRVFMSRTKLLLVASHIICDLTTLKVLLHDVGVVYHGRPLLSVKRTYEDTAHWNLQLPSTILQFWSKYLHNLPDSGYDVGKYNCQRTGYNGSSQVSKIAPTVFHAMTAFTATSKVSLHQLALAAVSLALTYSSKDQDIVLGAPYLNRTSSDNLETVGLFLEPLPIRIKYPSQYDRSWRSLSIDTDQNSHLDPFLLAVCNSSRAALSHEIPWNRLLKHLNITPEYPNHPIFDVMVTFHETDPNPLLPIPFIEPLYTWSDGSKFKLMVEFQGVSQDTLILRLEHDSECFSSEDIHLFRELVILALTSLSNGDSHMEVKKELQQLAATFHGFSSKTPSSELFAMPLESL